MSDTITVLRSFGPRLAKRWTEEKVEGYDRAKHFRATELKVHDLRDLSNLLRSLERDPTSCVIRGAPRDGVDLSSTTRDLESFYEIPRHWVCFDVDDWDAASRGLDPIADPEEAVRAFIQHELPAEFHFASCHWQLSNSAGVPGKEHLLKVHLWFWLAKPYTGDELTAWARHHKLPIDVTVFRTVQVHYTAAPVFDAGVSNPVRQRSGFIEGMLGDDVVLEIEPEVFEKAAVQRDRPQRHEMVDPTEKPGIVGAFCRAYSPARAIRELLGGHFEFEGDSDVRLTWLQGGGAPGGAVITDDGLHVYNSHASDPIGGRAVNAFDLVRIHLFGSLDGGPPNAPVNEMPSYIEMSKLARTLPDVQAELDAARVSAAEDFDEFVDDPEDGVPVSGEEARAVVSEREAIVARAINAIAAAGSASDLEQQVAQRLRNLDWSAAERERLAVQIRDKFKDLTGTKLPIGTARQWLAADAPESGFTDVDADGRLLGTLANFRTLVRQQGVVIRYNVISKEDEILVPGATFSADNHAVVSLTHLYSECVRLGLPIGLQILKTYVTALADENQYNPALAWIESRPWDGVSRLDALYDTIVSPKEEIKRLVMRRWLLQSVAVLHNTGEIQARGVLTFQGAQYQGKSRWIRALVPPGLAKTGMTLDPHNKDQVIQCLGYWISELGEIDATFRRADIAALKSFIAEQEDVFRRPYAVAASKYPRRTSFFASVNGNEFLADPTGSTRFWVVPVEEVLPIEFDTQQLWAEVLHLWRGGEQHWMTNEEMQRLLESNEEHTAVSGIEMAVADGLPWGRPGARLVRGSTRQIAEAAGWKGAFGIREAQLVGATVRRLVREHYPAEVGRVAAKLDGYMRMLYPIVEKFPGDDE